MKLRAITEAQIDQATEMRERSVSLATIARVLGVNVKTLDYHLRRLGVFPPGWTHRADKRRTRSFTDKNGRKVRAFTPEDDAILMKMDAEGASYTEIGRRLNRKSNSVRARAVALANREMLEE